MNEFDVGYQLKSQTGFNDWISDINLFDIKIPETNRKIKPSAILELDDFICPKVRTF